jgi:hypothetical protein
MNQIKINNMQHEKKELLLALAFFIFVIGIFIYNVSFVYSETGSTAVTKVNSASASSLSSSSYESLMSGVDAAGFSSGEELFDLEVTIPVGGCQPSIVRSDLLEEQNVPVFCQLVPLKVNPAVSIAKISSVSIVQKQTNNYISGVGFHPSNSAINSKSGTSFPTTSSIGYVVVVLKKQTNENAMPENVTTTLAASLSYGSETGYIGKNEFYIPVLSDSEFADSYIDYSFLDGKAYLRVDDMDENSATISIYTSVDKKFSTVKIEKGKTSKDFYLSSKTGGEGFRITLKEITIAETKAKINVNGDSFDVVKGGKFYDDKCTLNSVEAYGQGTGSVKVTCTGVSKVFDLEKKIDKAKLSVSGASNYYSLGEAVDSGKKYYLVYAGKIEGNNYVVVADLSGISGDKTSAVNDITKLISKETIIKNEASKTYKGLTINLEIIKEGEKGKNGASEIKYVGTSASNSGIGDNTKTYFKKAISAYDEIKQTFSSSNAPAGYKSDNIEGENKDTSGVRALWKEYDLADLLGQNEEKLLILSRIENDYPDSKYNGKSPAQLREQGSLDLLISGEKSSYYDEKSGIRMILESVHLPTNEEASVDLTLVDYQTTSTGNIEPIANARFNEKIIDDDLRTITLVSFDDNSVRFSYKCSTKDNSGKISEGKEILVTKKSGEELDLKQECKLKIKINKIKVKKVSHILLTPITTGKSRETNFSFSIGIEKRAFAMNLTTEEANSKITELNEQISDFKNMTESLSDLIKGMKYACLATSAYLNIKNLFFSEKGEASARKEVMANWNDLCEGTKMQQEANAKNQQECIDKKSSDIENEIKLVSQVIEAYNGIEKSAKDSVKDKTGNNDNEAKKIILNRIISSVGSLSLVGGEETMNSNAITTTLNELKKKDELLSQVTYSDLSDLYLNINMANKNINANSKQTYNAKAYSKMKEISELVKDREVPNSIEETTKTPVIIVGSKNTNDVLVSEGIVSWKDVKSVYTLPNGDSITDGDSVASFNFEGQNYLAVLTSLDGKIYSIEKDKIYEIGSITTGKLPLTKSATQKTLSLRFIKGESYNNKCINCNYVKVFSTAPYKGMPAVLPFDCVKGWYVYAKQNLASGFGLGTAASKTYFDSGQLNSFYICNVGANGLIEEMQGDDTSSCIGIDISADQTIKLPVMDEKTSRQLVEKARKAIKDSQKKLSSNPTEITVENCPNMKVRNSAGETGSKCTDSMSSSDCKLLFNVCDPVVCPSSRCNLGGKYTVENVIQSGIIGSTLLCFPNFIAFNKESGVIIPVCLTGIYAGLESWTSILESYRDCINESITNNKTVGICDAINSVYMCDFFWRQAGPFVNTILENLFLGVFGEKNEGGGEYAFTSDAISNADKSVSYMQSTYGKDSKMTFGFRSITNSIAAEVCKSSASATYPDQFEAMLEPESPVQYTAYFQEESFNDAVSPPRSQYKVFYHIYAGESGHSFSVYLKNRPSYDGYNGDDISNVASGYVAKGKYASESKDFVDVKGFKELCIKIDLQEECGFKSVSTEFALDYAKDKAVSEMASSSVTTEKDCVSGGSSLWGAVSSMNIQQAAEGVLDSNLQNYGVTRVCSGKNPGYGSTAESRWKDVGYCDNKNIRCWVDTNSVKNAISGKGLENESLSEIDKTNMNNLISSGYFDTTAGASHIETLEKVYNNILNQIESDSNPSNKLSSASYDLNDNDYNGKTYKGRKISDLATDVESLSKKLISTDQKIELAFYEAGFYDWLASILYNSADDSGWTEDAGSEGGDTSNKVENEFTYTIKDKQLLSSGFPTRFIIDTNVIRYTPIDHYAESFIVASISSDGLITWKTLKEIKKNDPFREADITDITNLMNDIKDYKIVNFNFVKK